MKHGSHSKHPGSSMIIDCTNKTKYDPAVPLYLLTAPSSYFKSCITMFNDIWFILEIIQPHAH
uniref:Uncharacterized protein n=1 Tax=Nelumbo nucifera TaxID=4432 RepID=A0A822Z7D7_NELNU|nr:TPA_asm: hypothetical protein HUJ06_000554 [Nelumbo nucifera]